MFAICVVTAWAVFVAAGLPLTTVDDLYFVGISESWRSTGILESRLMTDEYLEGFPSRAFHFHPPIYPAVLAAWLVFFPVSELSLQTFVFLCLLIGICGIILISRHLSVSSMAVAAICVVYTLGFSRLGLRPEVLAVSALLLGTGLMLRGRLIDVVLGFLCYGISVLCYPFTAPAALMFSLYSIWLQRPVKIARVAVVAVCGFLSIGCFLGLSLWLIEWRALDFLASYRLTVDVVNPGSLFTPSRYWQYIERLSSESRYLPKWPFVAFGPLLLCVYTATRRSAPKLLLFCWAFTLGLLGAAGMAHLRAVDFSVFYSLMVSAMLLDASLRRPLPRLAGQLFVVGLALIANVAVVTSVMLQSSLGDLRIQAIRSRAAAVPPGQRILVDSSVARHVFNWQLGPNVYDFRTSRKLLAPFGANIHPRHINDISADEVWIVGRDFSYATESPGVATRPATLFGKSLGSVGRLNCDPLFIYTTNGVVHVE